MSANEEEGSMYSKIVKHTTIAHQYGKALQSLRINVYAHFSK